MKSHLEEIVVRKINEYKKQGRHGQKILNLIKEDPLHLMVLDFLYTHKTYKGCVMYGGSILRMAYDLPRMSVDLDFQIDVPLDQESFQKEISDYFKDKYGYKNVRLSFGTEEKDTMVVKINFSGLEAFKIPDVAFTTLKIRVDLNRFDTGVFQQVLIPIRNEYAIDVRTYPIATLMASKIAAALNRVQYGVSDSSGQSLLADYKGRDIYDLIWYLQKGVIPNLRYLAKKGFDFPNYPNLFKKMKERMVHLSDGGKALKADLMHLYLNPEELDEWMKNWNRLFEEGLSQYSFVKVGNVEHVRVTQNFDTDHFVFTYVLTTDLGKEASMVVLLSGNFLEDFPITGWKRDNPKPQIASGISAKEEKMVREYAGLFASKIEDFLKRIQNILPRWKVQTKLIAYARGAYDPDAIVSFTSEELKACQFEDLV